MRFKHGEMGIKLDGIVADGITYIDVLMYISRIESLKPQINFKEYTFIIFGKSGPTGKSTLCKELRDKGYNAFDISEDVCAMCNCSIYSNEDGYIVDLNRKMFLIVLNKNVKDKLEKTDK